MKIRAVLFFIFLSYTATAQVPVERSNHSKFKQLGTELPTPNSYRAASGAPGHKYWQQQVDYDIAVTLNETDQSIQGQETITYYNNSPDELTYLWVQLDQNVRAKDSNTYKTNTSTIRKKTSMDMMKYRQSQEDFDGGFKISAVTDSQNKKLPYIINKTMMRIDLPKALKNGEKFEVKIGWSYNINDRMKIGGRSGYEYFEEDKNHLFTIAQFFPRMAVYSDDRGWNHKQFLGRGEFTLPFGNYKVSITVPDDHIVGATGELKNASTVLTEKQIKLFEDAKNASSPVIIVSQSEAEKKEKKKSKKSKTWVYEAENVRDFAFASSRKFIWDAMGVKIGDKTVYAMSYYPKEGNPLWELYSTEVVAQTLETYSKFTIDYPYPVAISVHTKRIGMEYPMICFNYGRPEKDGTYTERMKYGMISVIIHEVGHNFFPMIINSDERHWTWMDEGLNTFCQYLTEQEWERGYPSRRGEPAKMVPYMKGKAEGMVPIMTNSESILQFGNNAYGKPATGLNILRETIMGRELFDYAFKEYSRRWAFKHPRPADFFRTMEDASAVDLDWFWRGWFYSTEPVDISIENVMLYEVDSKNPEVEKKKLMTKRDGQVPSISEMRNKKQIAKTRVEKKPKLADFYTKYDELGVTSTDKKNYSNYLKTLEKSEQEMISKNAKIYFYQVELKNVGGLVMPVIIQFEYEDGTKETKNIPAEIWKLNNKEVKKVFKTSKKVKQLSLDPMRQTADINEENNFFPPKVMQSRFEIFKRNQRPRENPMQQNRRERKGK